MPTEHYGDYQMQIYLDGLHGKLPRFPVDHASLEAAAVEVLPSWVYSYVAYGAGDGTHNGPTSTPSRGMRSCLACWWLQPNGTCRCRCLT